MSSLNERIIIMQGYLIFSDFKSKKLGVRIIQGYLIFPDFESQKLGVRIIRGYLR